MINVDAVDFSDHRSEEVISFFWRLVYYSYWLFKKCFLRLTSPGMDLALAYLIELVIIYIYMGSQPGASFF